MPRTDFSLRKSRYNPTLLLPRFFENLDQQEGHYAYGITCDVWQQNWFSLFELINGIVSPAHDSWYASANTLPYLANLLGTPDLHAFPKTAQNFMVWCWPAIRAQKGVRQSVVSLAALLGYKLEVIPLWSAFALPNPANLADASNDPYLSEQSALPLAINGVPNPEVDAIRAGNGLWVVNTTLAGGETLIPLYNHPAFTQPSLGFTVFFPDRLEPYYVVDSTKTSLTLDKPLSSLIGNRTVAPGTNLPVFNPEIIYPASFYDLFIVTDPTNNDPSSIVAAFDDKLAVLTDSVIPFRDRLRRILAAYRASATVTLDCPLGLYGSTVTRSASATSRISFADALAKARLSAHQAAAADLRCEPIAPVVEITGLEPLSAQLFFSTFTYTASCPADYYGEPTTVTVTRTSRLSQAAADAVAYQAARNLALARIECTRNIPPLIELSAPSPSYLALASVVARCETGSSGPPALASASGNSVLSYASAEAAALASATEIAQAALRCVPATGPQLFVAEFRYWLEIGLTVTETCPAGVYGPAITVTKTYHYESRGSFQPTYPEAYHLAEASAVAEAQSQLACYPDAGPIIAISEPVSFYSALATETVHCPNGMNWRAGNVVTATYTGISQESYLSAEQNAGSGARASALASLDCEPPSFNPEAVLLVAKDEFGFDPRLRLDKDQLPFNSGHDFYAKGLPLSSARSDFERFLEEDAPKLLAAGVSTLILELNWFTPLEAKSEIIPALSDEAADRLEDEMWSAGGSFNGLVLPLGRGIDRGGTSDDAALKRALIALTEAGFRLGLSPVVRFLDTTNSQLVDRHLVSFTLSELTGWCANYRSYLSHYAGLVDETGIKPYLFNLGSGYRALTHSHQPDVRRLFLRTLLELKEEFSARWPQTILPYCARYDEYGWDNELKDFPLDGLWQAGVSLGLIWSQPIGASPPALESERFFPDLPEPFFKTVYDNAAIELGMRFQVKEPGYVVGVSFYRGPLNTHPQIPHRGNLWDGSGNLIGSLEFAKELPTGWVSALFRNRHLIFPGEIYTISYHSFGGYYSMSTDYFTSSISVGSITVPAKGGLYTYGPESIYPHNEVRAANYFVDVIFTPQPGPLDLSTSLKSIRAGTISGENMFSRYDLLPEDNRLLSFSDHSGKAYSQSYPLAPVFGSKNLQAYLSEKCAHYLPIPTNYDSGAAPLAPNTYLDEFSFSGLKLSGPALLADRFSAFSPHGTGVQFAPANPFATGLELSGGHAVVELPLAVKTGLVTQTVIEIDFKANTQSNPFPILASIPDGPFRIEYNPAYRQLRARITLSHGEYISPGLGVAQEEITRYYLRYYRDLAGSWHLEEGIYRDGVLSSSTYQLPDQIVLGSSSGLLYLGNLNPAGEAAFNGVIYRFYFAAEDSNANRYGGTFHFEEAYSGVRTTFPSGKIQALVTELGFPSIEGGLIEPETELRALAGGPLRRLPGWLDDQERAYLQLIQTAGYAFSDLRGPYGTNFKRSPVEQIYGLNASLWALRAAGIRWVAAAEVDVRSPEAFSAIKDGHYTYPDGPLYPFRRVLNGKLALGLGG